MIRVITIITIMGCHSPIFATVSLRLMPTGGAMVQPTSSYYHYVYGGMADLGFLQDRLLIRGVYLERPEFRSAGFRDAEFWRIGMMGYRFNLGSYGHGNVHVGYGDSSGYIEVAEDSGLEAVYPRRSYRIEGGSLAMAYEVTWDVLVLSLSHLAFVGYQTQLQLDAYVLWPYSFFLVSVGYHL